MTPRSKSATASTLVIVAVKPLADAKSRMSGVEESQRQALVLAMLEDVLAAVRAAHGGEIVLLSSDPAYDATAQIVGARRAPDAAPGYRAAVQAALIEAAASGVPAVLMLPADIPGLTTEDVTTLLDALASSEVVVTGGIDGGTSALGLRPPTAIPVAFGPDSGELHRRIAAASGRRLLEVPLASLAVDVDTAADLEAVAAVAGAATARVIAAMRQVAAPRGLA